MKKVCIIPARGGSKRIPNKNHKPFSDNFSLVQHAVNTVKQTNLFDQIIVNSDCEDILNSTDAIKYKRPIELSNDTTFVIDVIKDCIYTLALENVDIVGVALPTCPLRLPKDINNAFSLFEKNKLPVVSVTTYETPIFLSQKKVSGRLKPIFPKDYNKSTRSTDHEEVYKFNEAIIFNTVREFKKQNNLIGKNPIPYFMPPERSIMIDYQYQFEIAQDLYRRYNGTN